MSVCAAYVRANARVGQRHQIPMQLELRAVSDCERCMLGMELGLSVRAVTHTPVHWATSPAPHTEYLKWWLLRWLCGYLPKQVQRSEVSLWEPLWRVTTSESCSWLVHVWAALIDHVQAICMCAQRTNATYNLGTHTYVRYNLCLCWEEGCMCYACMWRSEQLGGDSFWG